MNDLPPVLKGIMVPNARVLMRYSLVSILLTARPVNYDQLETTDQLPWKYSPKGRGIYSQVEGKLEWSKVLARLHSATIMTCDPPFFKVQKVLVAGFKPSEIDEKKALTLLCRSQNEVNAVGANKHLNSGGSKYAGLEDLVYSDDDENMFGNKLFRDLNSALKQKITKQFGRTEEPKCIHALKDPSWIEAMQEELLQFKLPEVWTLVDLPNGKKGTKWVYRNKKDKRGIVIKNKARLIEEEVYVYQPLRFKDLDFLDIVYKVEKALYGLHQAPRAWYETLSTYLLDNGFQRGKIDKTLFIRRDKGLQVKQKEDGIFISQDKYVTEILKKFGFTDVKTQAHYWNSKAFSQDKVVKRVFASISIDQ
ncbi:putative ribonuclease H-like domain-containing protein [Tanacetum coccineum]